MWTGAWASFLAPERRSVLPSMAITSLGAPVSAATQFTKQRWNGCFGRDYLRHNGPEHVLCFAPTRSGKGVGLVVPSLLTWPGSAIVHDIKGENWQLTAGWRARFSRVLLFDPTNPVSAGYNPLLEVRRRHRGARRSERRRHPGRPGRSARTAQSLGKDQPFAPGRRYPPRPLRGGPRRSQDRRRPRNRRPTRLQPPRLVLGGQSCPVVGVCGRSVAGGARAGRGQCGWWQDAALEPDVLVVARLLRAYRWDAGN